MKLREKAERIEHANGYSIHRSISYPGSSGGTSRGKTKETVLGIKGKDVIVVDTNEEFTFADQTDVLIGERLVDREIMITRPSEEVKVGNEQIVVRMETADEALNLYYQLMNERNRRRLEELSTVRPKEGGWDDKFEQIVDIEEVRNFDLVE